MEKQRAADRPFVPMAGQKPVFKMELFQPIEKKGPPQQYYPSMYPFPIYDTPMQPMAYPTTFGNRNYISQMHAPNTYPIIKNYNLNIPDPTGGHGMMGNIIEDMLPAKDLNNSFITLGERLKILNFIRSVLIKQSDGENITLKGRGDSLMSYIKYLTLNPYHYHHYYNNPYKSLPYGMILYSSCYPIKYDSVSRSSACASNSTSINIRFYKLSNEEYDVKKTGSTSNYFKYDNWREIAYYEYIRENIIKKKKCPNFITMYSYYICENCGIDYDKIETIKGTNLKTSDNLKIYTNPLTYTEKTLVKFPGYVKENNVRDIYKDVRLPNGKRIVNLNPRRDELDAVLVNKYKVVQKNPALQTDKSNSGHSIVALTEAPTQNLFTWASKIYVQDLNRQKMINTGMYDEKIWFSIIFQILAGLFTMQMEYIYMRNMTIQDNIYIKDLQNSPNPSGSVGYWKYIINGIPFYVPNYGYMVLIDTNFKDIPKPSTSIISPTIQTKKILADNIYGDKNNKAVDLGRGIIENLMNIINKDVFSREFKSSGGMIPPDNVLEIISNINNDAKILLATPPPVNDVDEIDGINTYILKYFKKFLNNRIGTPLREKELTLILKTTEQFKTGDMIIHKTNTDEYIWAMYLKPDTSPKKYDDDLGNINTSTILSKDNKNEFIQLNIPNDILLQYSRHEKLVQNDEIGGLKFTEENLLETYNI